MSDERSGAVLGYTQEEFVIVHVDTHKPSENGTLVGISDDFASLLNWYQKSTQKYFNPLSPGIKLQILLLCFHTFLTEVVGRSC